MHGIELIFNTCYDYFCNYVYGMYCIKIFFRRGFQLNLLPVLFSSCHITKLVVGKNAS